MTLASKITLVRVFLIPVVMAFMYLSGGVAGNIWLILGLVVFIIASLSDYVDGHIARKYNHVTDFGKFLDPLADKLLVIAVMTVFCQWNLMQVTEQKPGFQTLHYYIKMRSMAYQKY